MRSSLGPRREIVDVRDAAPAARGLPSGSADGKRAATVEGCREVARVRLPRLALSESTTSSGTSVGTGRVALRCCCLAAPAGDRRAAGVRRSAGVLALPSCVVELTAAALFSKGFFLLPIQALQLLLLLRLPPPPFLFCFCLQTALSFPLLPERKAGAAPVVIVFCGREGACKNNNTRETEIWTRCAYFDERCMIRYDIAA